MTRHHMLAFFAAAAIALLVTLGFVPAVADAMHPAERAALPASDLCAECALPALGRVEFASDLVQ